MSLLFNSWHSCKLHLTSAKPTESDRTLVEDTVRNMFQGDRLRLAKSQSTCLADKGWLCTASNGKPSLHPMVLRAWATEEGEGDDTNCLPVVLSKMFRCDFEAASKGEPFAEEVFIYFEQARRLSLPDGEGETLHRHYPGANCRGFSDRERYSHLTLPKKRIVHVDNFEDRQHCSDVLKEGSILICKKINEQGVECIFPFHTGTSRITVWCGGVQVKCTGQEVEQSNVGENISANSFLKWLEKDESYKCFGIVVSTQQGNAADFKSVCEFNTETLTELMEPKVGPLRVLYEKMPAPSLQGMLPPKRKQVTDSEAEPAHKRHQMS